MWLESEVGRQHLRVRLPRASGSQRGRRGRCAAPAVDRPIVVIEDDRRSLDLLAAYLQGAAITVVTARNGQSGLDAVRRDHPSAVLLDIRLPGMDGWEVLRALKADPETARHPRHRRLDRRRALPRRSRWAPRRYLVKPVSRDDLLGALTAIGLPVATGDAVDETEAP